MDAAQDAVMRDFLASAPPPPPPPPPAGVRKITVSLPPNVVDQLDFVSSRLRCSRSALLSEVLGHSMPSLVQIASCIPEVGQDVTEVDARRLRGVSAEVIGEQVRKLLAMSEGVGQDDLFSK